MHGVVGIVGARSGQAEGLEGGLSEIPEENWVNLLQHLRVDLQELALVLDRDQRAPRPTGSCSSAGSCTLD